MWVIGFILMVSLSSVIHTLPQYDRKISDSEQHDPSTSSSSMSMGRAFKEEDEQVARNTQDILEKIKQLNIKHGYLQRDIMPKNDYLHIPSFYSRAENITEPKRKLNKKVSRGMNYNDKNVGLNDKSIGKFESPSDEPFVNPIFEYLIRHPVSDDQQQVVTRMKDNSGVVVSSTDLDAEVTSEDEIPGLYIKRKVVHTQTVFMPSGNYNFNQQQQQQQGPDYQLSNQLRYQLASQSGYQIPYQPAYALYQSTYQTPYQMPFQSAYQSPINPLANYQQSYQFPSYQISPYSPPQSPFSQYNFPPISTPNFGNKEATTTDNTKKATGSSNNFLESQTVDNIKNIIQSHYQHPSGNYYNPQDQEDPNAIYQNPYLPVPMMLFDPYYMNREAIEQQELLQGQRELEDERELQDERELEDEQQLQKEQDEQEEAEAGEQDSNRRYFQEGQGSDVGYYPVGFKEHRRYRGVRLGARQISFPLSEYFPIIIKNPFEMMFNAVTSMVEYGQQADTACKKPVKKTSDKKVDGTSKEESSLVNDLKESLVNEQKDSLANKQQNSLLINKKYSSTSDLKTTELPDIKTILQAESNNHLSIVDKLNSIARPITKDIVITSPNKTTLQDLVNNDSTTLQRHRQDTTLAPPRSAKLLTKPLREPSEKLQYSVESSAQGSHVTIFNTSPSNNSNNNTEELLIEDLDIPLRGPISFGVKLPAIEEIDSIQGRGATREVPTQERGAIRNREDPIQGKGATIREDPILGRGATVIRDPIQGRGTTIQGRGATRDREEGSRRGASVKVREERNPRPKPKSPPSSPTEKLFRPGQWFGGNKLPPQALTSGQLTAVVRPSGHPDPVDLDSDEHEDQDEEDIIDNLDLNSGEKGIFGMGSSHHRQKLLSKDNTGSGVFIHRLKVRRGGVAIAGPGGIATAGSGGTAIVGPNGYAYTHPDSLAIAGSGTKVVAVEPSVNLSELVKSGANHTREDGSTPRVGKVVAVGPVIYYNRG